MRVAEARNAEIRARQKAARGDKPRPFVPVPGGAPARPADDNPPTEARGDGGGDGEALAPNDMRYFVDHDMTAAEVPTSQRSTIMEPTTINLGDAIFYTGNWFAAKSTNGGSTFSYINPYTFFPSVNGGFCCDQVSAYAPAQDMALWGLQYVDDGTSNRLRIARAIGSADIASDGWVYYDFSPTTVGFPTGVWFDYPSFTVGTTWLYISSNAFLTSNNSFAGNVVIRMRLADMAAGGSTTFNWFRSDIGTERFTEGAGSTMYWGGFLNTTQMRIHRWDDASGSVAWDDVNLSAFNWLSRDGIATSPDGTNWALRADSRPTGAYVAGGVIGFLWSAKQGGSRPKPYTVHARFNEATRALISQSDIWNNDYAWMYPSVMPNASGNLAGTLQIGGAAAGSFAYPGTQMWVTDDLTGASTTVGALYFVSAGDDGPNNNGWGDYFTVRRHKTRPNTWVSASHALFGGGVGANAVPKYLWFGRERDNPTAAEMTSPPPGSTLTGSSVTFQWSTGSAATQYWLYVGTTGPGSTNILNENQNTNTSRLVSGLSADGSTLYVRLWSLLPSGWVFNDYTYTAFTTVVCQQAAMTSPVPGSILPGGAAAFTWNAGAGNTQYWLYVGTSLGGTQIWNESQGTNLTRTVTGIPTDGSTIYVRLWSFCSDWSSTDYTYTAATVGLPNLVVSALTGPALASPSQVVNLANAVRNNGTSTAGAFLVGLYLSTDNVCTTADTFLASRAVAGLGPGLTDTTATPVTIPAGVAHFFCAIADIGGTVAESNEMDNTASASVDIVAATPTVNLKVNGVDGASVSTTGPVHVTLDISPSTFTTPVAWYWAIVVNGNLSWVTSTGLSTTPAPLATAPPVTLTGATLLNLTLPTGTTITNVLFLLNGGSVLASDFITASVVP
jgi:hypothetical protein